MATPIPVFSFVFAAYAATSMAPRISLHTGLKQVIPGTPFLTAWRARSARSDVLYVRVGLLTKANKDGLRLASQHSSEDCEEIWLEEIVETHLGFVGTAMSRQALPKTVTVGRRLRFHQINVLDWRVEPGESAHAALHKPSIQRNPRELLDDLLKIVGP